MRGAIDNLTTSGAAGWYFSGSSKKVSDVVDAVLFGRIIGEAEAILERPDIKSAGWGDGRCGFSIDFYESIPAEHLPFVKVRPQNSDLELPRTNLTGFPDFFRDVQAKFPGSNRSRSVFGGLWTDRYNAKRQLYARARAGLVPINLVDKLRSFVDEGYIKIQLTKSLPDRVGVELDALNSAGIVHLGHSVAGTTVLREISDILFDESILAPIKAIVEDIPTFYKTSLQTKSQPKFHQPSSTSELPAPNNCIQILCVANADPIRVEIISGSHEFPEFNANGNSRWTSDSDADAIESAIRFGASIDNVTLHSDHALMIGPGTIYKILAPSNTKFVSCLAVPSWVTPAEALKREMPAVRFEHISGAAVVA